ncbi:MAG: alginate export family protein, partial [candidate division KSB1 bacterium]|nr:alginate export family protein [candidate division KSB1 bacterium]
PLEVNHAYFEIKTGRHFCATLGRQQITFRDRRIFGAGNWSNTGRYVWDAAVLKHENRLFDAHFILGRYVYHDPRVWPNHAATHPTAAAVYSALKCLPVQLDLFYVYKNGRLTSSGSSLGNLHSHSLGFWFKKEWEAWNVGASAVSQFGRRADQSIRAFGSAVWAGCKLDEKGRCSVKTQIVLGSGDKNPRDNVYGTFDGVFGGAAVDHYGWMSLFFWKNIREYRIDLTWRPIPNLRLIGEYHHFTLDRARDAWYSVAGAQRVDPLGASGRELGHEIDLIARSNVTKQLELLAGYSFFMPGTFVKNTGDAPICRVCFLQSTFFF